MRTTSRLTFRTLAVALATAGAITLAPERDARADLVAAYVAGYGGLSSPRTDTAAPPTSSLTPGLGVQVGARLLFLEAYGSYTSFGSGMAVQRAILGLSGGLELGKFRLQLRVGGGAMGEQGGALTGPVLGTESHAGVVGRAGVSLERRIAPMLLAGVAVDAETFALGVPNSIDPDGWTTGQDVFASFQLKFEIGL